MAILTISIEQLIDFLWRLTDILTGTPDEKIFMDILDNVHGWGSDDLSEITKTVSELLKKYETISLTADEALAIRTPEDLIKLHKRALVINQINDLRKIWNDFF